MLVLRLIKMSVKLIGRTTNLYGKTLWEIIGNLRNAGIGRLITRNSYARYDEPCFFRVLSVEPTAQIVRNYCDTRLWSTITCNSYILLQENKARKVIVHVEKIFRGKQYKEPVEIYGVSYKPDYRLIPKDEEQLWWKRLASCKPREKLVPGSIELPPLMKVSINYNTKEKVHFSFAVLFS